MVDPAFPNKNRDSSYSVAARAALGWLTGKAGEMGEEGVVVSIVDCNAPIEGLFCTGHQPCVNEDHDVRVSAKDSMHVLFDIPIG
jgi:hypothetical protein